MHYGSRGSHDATLVVTLVTLNLEVEAPDREAPNTGRPRLGTVGKDRFSWFRPPMYATKYTHSLQLLEIPGASVDIRRLQALRKLCVHGLSAYYTPS